MIIAVNFDGTIVKDAYPNIGLENKGTIDYLKYMKKKGYSLILWTCRQGEKLEEALKKCAELELEFDAVNENLEEGIKKYGADSRKIYADIYIDDKSFIPAEVYFEKIKEE